MADWKAIAKECGFDVAEDLDPTKLQFMPEVRDMCAACPRYDKSWACPPACGSLEEWTAKAARFTKGVLLQCIGELEDSFDIEGLQALGERNTAALTALVDRTHEANLDCLPMGTGGCTRCKKCTYPDEPCRFPDKKLSSMEACGLLVNQVCTDNGVPYNYGPGKMAYSSCLLFNED